MNVRQVFCSIVLIAGLAGCGGGGTEFEDRSGGLPGARTGGVEGRISLSSLSRGVVREAEPNDSFGQASFLGSFHAGERVIVLGSCTAVGGADPFDGFHLELPERVRVDASLFVPFPTVNEFHLGVYDPTGMQFVETLSVDESPELMTFHAKGSIDLVVLVNSGGGDYELRLQFYRADDPVSEREPNDLPEEAQYLGDLRPGDQTAVFGTGSDATDSRDGMLFAFPVACRLQCHLSYEAFKDFDIVLLDASTDLSAPTPLASFEGAPASPQTGVLDVAAGSLVTVQVRASTGSGPWTLTLAATEPPSPAPAPGARPLAPLANERVLLSLPESAPVYGLAEAEFVHGGAICKLRCGDETAGYDAMAALDCRVANEAPDGMCCVRFHVPEHMGEEHCARCTLARIRELRRCGVAEYVEPNFIYRPLLEPNDTYYGLQWHYDMINLPQAWDITTGSDDVIVAVLDTGDYPHPDLSARQTAGGFDMISDAFYARDGDGYDSDPTDEGDLAFGSYSSFHGTHVAGTIGAVTDNALGVAGVTWATRLMTVRVLGLYGGSAFDVSQGILYAAGLPNASGALPPEAADVINMSLGSPDFSQALADSCIAARNAGTVVIAAAGNEGSSAPSYPAANQGVVSVSALGSNRSITAYSNRGPAVDICAPGGSMALDQNADGYPDGVLSTLIDDFVSPPVPILTFSEGTSMAAPHVAGVAALMLAVDPALTPGQLEGKLLSSAVDLGAPGRDDLYGDGLVDAFAAVKAAGGVAPGGPQLEVFPVVLNFGLHSSTLDVALTNLGTDFLQIDSVSVNVDTPVDWLSAEAHGPADALRSHWRVRVTVSRTGLPEGAHRGTVEIESNGGTKTVEVIVEAPPPIPPPPLDIDIYVVAIPQEEGEPPRQVVINPSVTLNYAFSGLGVGDYVFVASTDLDDDGVLCEAGEYCGAFPVVSDPVAVTVFQDLVWTNVNFALVRLAEVGSSGVGGRAVVRTGR